MARRGGRSPVCTTCHKTFKRMEHCLRHERAHKLERPYDCRFCLRPFGRKDLVVRHEKNLHPELWAMLHQSNQDPLPDNSQQESLCSPLLPSDHQDSTDETQTTLNLTVFQPSMGRLEAGDETTGRLPRIPTSCFPMSPPVTTIHQEKGHESSTNNGGSNGAIGSVVQTVSPEPDNHDWVQAADDGSSLTLTNEHSFPLATNPVYPLSPIDSNAAQTEDIGPQHVSADDLITFDLALGNDDIATDELFSLSTDMDLRFDYMDFDSEQFQCAGYAVGFELSPRVLESSMSTESVPHERLTPAVRDHLQMSTSTDRRKAQSSGKKSFTLPRLINDVPPKARQIYLDQRKRAELVADFARRMAYRCDYEEDIPDCTSLHRFLTQFFESFNTHLPIFHVPTFDPSRNPSPLVLAMCSIGAMFQLERKRATRLRQLASSALIRTDCIRQSKEPGKSRPVWMVQCKLLLLYGAILGGNATAACSALEEIGYLHCEFRSRMAAILITCEEKEVSSLSWQEWIDRETSKRLLFGIFILSSLLTIAYNIPPGISTSCDLHLELPEEERLWTAPTDDAWKTAFSLTSSMKRLKTSQVLKQLLFGKEIDAVTETRLGLYAAVVLVHAVNIHAWHVSQGTYSFTHFLTDQGEDQVARRTLKQVEAVLDRCKQVFSRSRCIEDGPPGPSESPLPFNGLNLLRSCYARVLCDGGGFGRAVLLSESDAETSLAAKRFVQMSEYDMPLLTKIVAFMVEALMMPSHLGRLVIRKTAALTWSVETAIVLWDCALYSTKWAQIISGRQKQSGLTPVEQKIMDDIQRFTSNCQDETGGHSSQAAILADTFAAHFDEVWVWQVTFQMGKVLRKLAVAYEENYC